MTTQVFDSVSRVLHETLGILDRDAMTRAAERIRSASRIEFYGLGTSAPIVQDAYYRFMRIGLNAAACVDPYIMNVSASLMQPGCLAIAISHTGRSIQTVEALRLAREHGADTLCITSYMDSPVTRCADIALVTSPCGSGDLKEATITRIAHIALLDSLCTYIAMSERERTAADQDELLFTGHCPARCFRALLARKSRVLQRETAVFAVSVHHYACYVHTSARFWLGREQ